MAFYDDTKKKPKTNYADKGSWDDEGAHYRGAKKPTSAAGRRFGPGARPAGDKPAGGHPQEDKPAYGRTPRQEGKPAYGGRTERVPRFDRSEGKPTYGQRAERTDRTPRSDRSEGKPAFGRRPAAPSATERAPRRGYEGFEKKSFERKPIERIPTIAPTPAPQEEIAINENLLSGRNPIREALKSGRDIEKLLVAKGELSGSAKEIVMMAKEKHIPVQEVDRARLDEITRNHQGMLAFASAYQYGTVEQMLEAAKAKNEDPFIILLDGITDPHNLGAIIRTAECVGAHGVIVPQRRNVGLTPAAVKASAGAVEHIPVARVTNLTRTIEQLRNSGLWFYAADMSGESYDKVDFKGGVGLVVGGEGEGISRLVLESCDRRVSLPLKGEIDSLNASVAAGILMYAALQSRSK